jgi:hypothetical protein
LGCLVGRTPRLVTPACGVPTASRSGYPGMERGLCAAGLRHYRVLRVQCSPWYRAPGGSTGGPSRSNASTAARSTSGVISTRRAATSSPLPLPEHGHHSCFRAPRRGSGGKGFPCCCGTNQMPREGRSSTDHSTRRASAAYVRTMPSAVMVAGSVPIPRSGPRCAGCKAVEARGVAPPNAPVRTHVRLGGIWQALWAAIHRSEPMRSCPSLNPHIDLVAERAEVDWLG